MWPWYALISMISSAILQLLLTRLTRLDVAPSAMLMGVFGVGTLFYVVHTQAVRTTLPLTPRVIALIVAAAALSYIGNMYVVRALAIAPNPGYVVAITGLQGVVVMLAAIAVLGSTLTWLKAVGVILCCIGLVLLII